MNGHRYISTAAGATLAFLAASFVVSSSAQADEGLGHVVVTENCVGQIGIGFRAYNDVPESDPISFQVFDNLLGVEFSAGLDAISYEDGFRTSGYEGDFGDAYDLTITGPGDYNETFAGTICEDEVIVGDPKPVTPGQPTFNDGPGTTGDTYTVPSTEGVDYMVGGQVVAPGTYPATGSVTITVKAREGYIIVGNASFSFEFTNVPAPNQEPVDEDPKEEPPPVDNLPVTTDKPAGNGGQVSGDQTGTTGSVSTSREGVSRSVSGLNDGFTPGGGWEETSLRSDNAPGALLWSMMSIVGLALGVIVVVAYRRKVGASRS
jgi:hypothetical protein